VFFVFFFFFLGCLAKRAPAYQEEPRKKKDPKKGGFGAGAEHRAITVKSSGSRENTLYIQGETGVWKVTSTKEKVKRRLGERWLETLPFGKAPPTMGEERKKTEAREQLI